MLYGKKALLEAMPPYQGGGDMIQMVTFENRIRRSAQQVRGRYPNIAGVIGLGAALDWLNAIGLDAVAAHEHDLLEYATLRLNEIPGLKIMGTARDKAALAAFTMQGIHPHDIGTILDREGSPSALAITAPSRSCSATACLPPRGRRSLSTTPATRWMPWSRPFGKSRSCSSNERLTRSLPGSDPGSQQTASQFSGSAATDP